MQSMEYDVIIVGGGPAGMMAAIEASRQGASTVLIEKNDKPGKKLFITGKGRCNVTNAADVEEMLRAVTCNEKFLYTGFYSFSNDAVSDFFERAGVPLKIERGGRVFPVSDHSSDIIGALRGEMKKNGVTCIYNEKVTRLLIEEKKCKGVIAGTGSVYRGKSVIVATGGLSYPSTGSDGDGYRWALAAGHHMIEPIPSLVPLVMVEEFCREMMGLSLKNVVLTVRDGKDVLFSEMGEMIFTHFGISGPLVLSASARVGRALHPGVVFSVDLKPALDEKKLDERLIRTLHESGQKQFKNSLGSLFPAKMIPVIVRLCGIAPDMRCCDIDKKGRGRLLSVTKNLCMTFVKRRDFSEAIITKGGISTKEVDPHTMESRLIHNLYFAGEVLDLDAVTGGYNLQIAWSTGYVAGACAAQTKEDI